MNPVVDSEIQQLKERLAKRWLNPTNRIQDIFRVRTSLGKLVPLIIPKPQQQILQEGLLGKAKLLVDSGLTFMTILNKGRQIGFSTLAAVEAILVAEDYPNTKIYYIADDFDQATDFLDKITQLARDANHYPEELGGGPILNVQDISKSLSKTINNTEITGLTGRTGGKRGKSGIMVIWDEVAWCISRKGEQQAVWDTILYYTRQGGYVRLQSTPRTTDDLFWKFYTKPEEYGMKSYYCPVIENWKEVDLKHPLYIDLDNGRRALKQNLVLSTDEINQLKTTYQSKNNYLVDETNKEIRQVNVKIPYPWVRLEELEKQRVDLEKFMQENLGVSVDEKYKLVPSEWIYRNITDEIEQEDRGISKNPYYILVDLAQANDITAITIVEKLPDETVVERCLDTSQETYDVQVERIWTHYQSFKPQYISIDNTGHGRVIGDLLEKKLRMAGLPLSILHRVDFTNSSKEVMAVGFRRLVQADKYKFLNATELHRESIRHVERVEKEVLEMSTRYSGKKWGRDDFFWSKAMIVYFTNLLMPSPVAEFGKVRFEPLGESISFGPQPTEMEKLKEEMVKPTIRDIARVQAIGKVIAELSWGAVDCPKVREARKPLFCCGCNKEDCTEWDYMKKVCEMVKVEPLDVWEKQKVYGKDEHRRNENETQPEKTTI